LQARAASVTWGVGVRDAEAAAEEARQAAARALAASDGAAHEAEMLQNRLTRSEQARVPAPAPLLLPLLRALLWLSGQLSSLSVTRGGPPPAAVAAHALAAPAGRRV